jgi:micrococcal nuclease
VESKAQRLGTDARVAATAHGHPDAGNCSSGATDATTTTEAATWVAPVDGKCPDGYPLKANNNSGIFHSPGGRFYDRTVAERCYARAEDAIADGYRPAKA